MLMPRLSDAPWAEYLPGLAGSMNPSRRKVALRSLLLPIAMSGMAVIWVWRTALSDLLVTASWR